MNNFQLILYLNFTKILQSVNILVTSSLWQMRLEMVTGASAGQMIVTVLDHNDRELFALQDNDALLGSHCIEENYRLHVSFSCTYFKLSVSFSCPACPYFKVPLKACMSVHFLIIIFLILTDFAPCGLGEEKE